MRSNIKESKKGGDNTLPFKLEYDKDGDLEAQSYHNLMVYRGYIKRHKELCGPYEKIFGVPFDILKDDSFDYEYHRKKRLGLLKPLNIQYEGNHDIDELEL